MKVKVICVVDNNFREIKLNEVYWTDDLFHDSRFGIISICNYTNRNYIGHYHKSYFMLLSEWREKQIKSVIDD